jgi:hypothetical protein
MDLYCPQCDEMLGQLKIFHTDFPFDKQQPSRSHTWFWTIGFFACFLLFLAQFYLVAHQKLSQNPQQRVWLEKICHTVPCNLPAYKNLDEFEIIHGNFQQVDNHYVFQAVLNNQADFAQHYPRIKLHLLDFSGKIFAERLFYPQDYLTTQSTKLMSSSETIEINLNIAMPSQKVGGYTFELI